MQYRIHNQLGLNDVDWSHGSALRVRRGLPPPPEAPRQNSVKVPVTRVILTRDGHSVVHHRLVRREYSVLASDVGLPSAAAGPQRRQQPWREKT